MSLALTVGGPTDRSEQAGSHAVARGFCMAGSDTKRTMMETWMDTMVVAAGT